MLKTAFETGRLSLNGYIHKAVFHHPRPFTPEEVKAFMFAQSQPLGDTLELGRARAAPGRSRLFTLNTESRELHEYRARPSAFQPTFRGFLVAGYLGQPK